MTNSKWFWIGLNSLVYDVYLAVSFYDDYARGKLPLDSCVMQGIGFALLYWVAFLLVDWCCDFLD